MLPAPRASVPAPPRSGVVFGATFVVSRAETLLGPRYAEEGRLVEAFGIGTAPLILPINRIGFEGKDVHLPAYHTGTSPVADALYDRIFDIQTGQFDWEGWSVICE